MHLSLTPMQRRWRRFRLGVKAVIAFGVIGMALVVGTAGLMLPWVVGHPEKVQRFLSDRLQREVTFSRLHGDWTPTGPVFQLDDVELANPRGDGPPFRIEKAELRIDFYAWLRAGISFSEFSLVGLEVDLVRRADGRVRVARLGRAGAASVPSAGLEALMDLAAVSLRGARVSVRDEASGRAFDLARLDGRYVGELGRRRIGGIAWATEGSAPLRFACEIDGTRPSRCFAAAEGLEPALWLDALPAGGMQPVSGRLDLQAWARFDDAVAEVKVEAETRDLVFRGVVPVALPDGDTVEPRTSLAHDRISARWSRLSDGWRLDVRDLADDGTTTNLCLTTTADGQRRTLLADRLDLSRASTLALLTDLVPLNLRAFLYEASPRGELHSLVAESAPDGAIALRARAEGVSLSPATRRPGFDPLSGTVLADRNAVVWALDPGQDVVLDYPHVFGGVVAARLHAGTLGMSRDPDGWRVEGTDLDFDGDGFGASARFSMLFDDGKRPTLDATVSLHEGTVVAAKQFWPLNVMTQRTREWLDRGLVEGTIAGGSVIVRGDLDNWPFDQHQGRFEGAVTLRDLVLDYHARWPQARIDLGNATFFNRAMDVVVEGGSVMDNRISAAHGVIEDFRRPVLGLDVSGSGTGQTLLELVRGSPIADNAGGSLVGLSIGGTATLGFRLDVPLSERARAEKLADTRLTGRVDLEDADLRSTSWGVRFERANGPIRFTNHGLATDDLAVTAHGDPATLAIAIGEFLADESNHVEASLRGEMTAASLLHDVPDLALLVPLMPGRSPFDLMLTVPRATEDGTKPSRLVATSSLRGIAVRLPAPLAKDADTAMPLRVTLDIPPGGGQLRVRLGRLMDLWARLPDKGRNVAMDVAFGADRADPPPPSGYVVHGDASSLDIGAWAAFSGAGGDDDWSVDLRTGELHVLSRSFEDVHVRASVGSVGSEVSLSGPAVSGRIALPGGLKARDGVTGEFERLYIPEPEPGARELLFNPAQLPPLHLWLRDARFGAAQLGEVRIETYPAAGGMQIEKLEAGSQNLEIRARGDWSLRDGRERTSLDLTFSAESLGRMLDTLGFVGMVEGGPTTARLAGSWAGGPAQFGLARMTGTLEAKVGAGSIVQVDSGAGRLFGLLNLAEIPRRLSLDFSDLFAKGFAFNAIEGGFELRDGNAYTTGLVVNGPSADIRVSGRTGLALRDYDQQLEVTPRVSGVLPVLGALAAGPAGAAAGVVAQGVLQNPLNEIAAARYKVTGSWDKPDIVLIARSRADAARGG
jgi:uncharacterized protein (TIGR02099 family)